VSCDALFTVSSRPVISHFQPVLLDLIAQIVSSFFFPEPRYHRALFIFFGLIFGFLFSYTSRGVQGGDFLGSRLRLFLPGEDPFPLPSFDRRTIVPKKVSLLFFFLLRASRCGTLFRRMSKLVHFFDLLLSIPLFF